MLRDLFVHVCIVVTFLFITGSILRNNSYFNNFRNKLVLGLTAGILGSTLMFLSIKVTPSIIIDFRYMAILYSALYGGVISTMISTAIIILCRIILLSGTTSSYIVSTVMMFSIAVLSIYVGKSRLSDFKKWTYMNLLGLVTHSLGFLYLLGFSNQTYTLLFDLWLIAVIAGCLIFYVANFIVQSNRAFREMKVQSKTDFLTGLNNVRQFDFSLNILAQKAKEHNEQLSLLFIDVDHFKKINDTYGHLAGDEVLRQLGIILSSCSRSFDIVSRNGGEEFSLLLLHCPHIQAIEIGERIRHVVEKNSFRLPDNKKINLTISIGVSTFLETTQSPDELLKQADDALYKAKKTGRNRVCSISLKN
jgi:diguanylate cyclase